MIPSLRVGPLRSLHCWTGAAALVLGLACRSVPPLASVDAIDQEQVRIVLVGDTGKPGPGVDRVSAAIATEGADAVIVLGDLVYPVGPVCRRGKLTAEAADLLDARIGTPLIPSGAPVLLALGNHDVAHRSQDPAREACYLAWAAARPEIVFPALAYTMRMGALMVGVVNTNDPTPEQAELLRTAFADHQGWTLVAGHHGLVIHHDKEHEVRMRRWLSSHELRPDFYANGHAHLLQYGVYDGISAITSGSGAKLRPRPSCQADGPGDCGEGQVWGDSVHGYAMLDVRPSEVVLQFKGVPPGSTGPELLFETSLRR